MLILGIDPGLERMGYGLIRREGSRIEPVAFGLFHTPPGPLGPRLVSLADQARELITAHPIDRLVTERLFFNRNSTTALDVAKALGAVLCEAARSGLETYEITPPEVKKAVVGQGNADKKQVEFMVTRLLGLAQAPKPDDVCDALAVAIAGAWMLPDRPLPR